MLKEMNRLSPGCRKITRGGSTVGEDLARIRHGGRGRVIGSEHKPLDLLARWMIFGSTDLGIPFAILVKGWIMAAYLAVGVPLALAIGFMICRMKEGQDWDRAVALIYLVTLMLLALLMPGS